MQTINKLDLGDALNAPDDTVTIHRDGNNLVFNSPAAGTVRLEDFILPGGVHALEDHTDVVITAAAAGEVLRFDGADWVDEAITIVSLDTTATGANLTSLTDNSFVNALHRHSELVAPDGAPDPALTIDNDGFLNTPGNLGIIGTGYALVRAAAGQPFYCDAGALFSWRDEDDARAVRMTLNSATGAVNMTGSLTVAGDIYGDFVSPGFWSDGGVLNASTLYLNLGGIICSATKGASIGVTGSIAGFILNYNVTVHAGGGQLTAGVTVGGAVVFSKVIPSGVANGQIDGNVQVRGTDLLASTDVVAMFIREDNGVAITVTGIQAHAALYRD